MNTRNYYKYFIISLLLLLISFFGNVYFLADDSNDILLLEKENELFHFRDSISNKLSSIEDSMERKYNLELNSKIGDDKPSDEAERLKSALDEIRRLRRDVSRSEIRMVPGMTRSEQDYRYNKLLGELMTAKNNVSKFQKKLDSLESSNRFLQSANNDYAERNQTLSAENIDYNERMVKGARPQFGTLICSPSTSDNKLTLKASKLDHFFITFDVLENPLIFSVVEEEITIRIIDPNGGVISLNNKELQDKKDVYSIRETVSVDGGLQKVKWAFPKNGGLGRNISNGNYTVELWTRGLLRQKYMLKLN
jgi:hypothetical protein